MESSVLELEARTRLQRADTVQWLKDTAGSRSSTETRRIKLIFALTSIDMTGFQLKELS